MIRTLTGIVVRQLWDCPQVPSTVIAIPENLRRNFTEEGDQLDYIRREATAHKKLFCDTTIEFRSAKWQLFFMEVNPAHGLMLPTRLSEEELK
jgi:hypothetical protein